MRSRLLAIAGAAALTLLFSVPQIALAIPNHYGTGIHLWVLRCSTGPGSWTNQYVSSSTCPNNAPPNCTCTKTLHDFPVDHPYPTRVNVGGGNGDDPGNIHVIFDQADAIQCGVSVEPPVEGQGSCGDHFYVEAVDEWDVDWELIEAVESLRGEIEAETGHPVESFSYGFATPN